MDDPVGKIGTIKGKGLTIPAKVVGLAPNITCAHHKGEALYKLLLLDHCYRDAEGTQIPKPDEPIPRGTMRLVLKGYLWEGCLTCHQFTPRE